MPLRFTTSTYQTESAMSRKPTNAMLKAALEARLAEIDALKLSLDTTQRELRDAKAQIDDLSNMIAMHRSGVFNTEHARDVAVIQSHAEAMAIARERAKAGIACYARGTKVFCSRTHEVIAQ